VVSVDDESECRAVAEDIGRQRPGWLVMWGCFSRRYTAYPLFPVRRGVIVVAGYPRALVARMDDAERLLRLPPGPAIPPPEGGGDGDGPADGTDGDPASPGQDDGPAEG
jgi:hypothetical protein